MSDTAPACSLSAHELRERRHELLPGLFERADEVTEFGDGVRVRLAHREGLLRELAEIIEAEGTCCGFLRFSIVVEPAGGPVTLEVSGPAGTAEMLRALAQVM